MSILEEKQRPALEVPEGCFYTEKDNPDFWMLETRPETRYIKLVSKNFTGGHIEYIFDEHGYPTAYRRERASELIICQPSDIRTYYQFEWPPEHHNIKVFFGNLFPGQNINPDNEEVRNMGIIKYKKSQLELIDFGAFIATSPTGDSIPKIYPTKLVVNSPDADPDWPILPVVANRRFTEYWDEVETNEQGEKTLVIRDLVYDLEWLKLTWIVKNGMLIARQEYLPQEVVKTIRAPLEIDYREVTKAAYGNSPTPSELNDCQWMAMNKFIPVGIGIGGRGAYQFLTGQLEEVKSGTGELDSLPLEPESSVLPMN